MFHTRRGGMETWTPDKPGVQGRCSSQLSYTPIFLCFKRYYLYLKNIILSIQIIKNCSHRRIRTLLLRFHFAIPISFFTYSGHQDLFFWLLSDTLFLYSNNGGPALLFAFQLHYSLLLHPSAFSFTIAKLYVNQR